MYPESKKLPLCRDMNLSTNTWKENIMADIQFVQAEVCLDWSADVTGSIS